MALSDSVGLLFKIRGDASDAVRAFDQTKREADSLKTSTAGLSSSFSSIAGPISVATAGIAAVGAAAAAGGLALFNLAKNTAEYGSAIFDATQKTGLGAETMSALKVAAEQSGSSFENVTAAVAKFNVLIGQAAAGNDKAEKILKEYGITSKTTQGALEQAISTIANMTSSTDQAAAAAALFKDRTGEILPVIKSFDGNLPALIEKLRELGLIMSDEDAKAADEFGDQMDTLNSQLGAVGRTIGLEVMPVFLEFAREVSNWLKENPGQVKAWGETFAYVLRRIGAGILEIKTNWEGLTDQISEFQKGNIIKTDALLERERQRAVTLQKIKNIVEGTDIRTIGGVFDQPDDFADWRAGRLPSGARPRTSSGDDRPDRQARTGGDTRTDKQAYLDFVRELKNLGVTINSGFRTYAEQAALYARLPRGQAARPGTSDHEFYRGVDLPPNVKLELLEKAARAAGVVLERGIVHQGTGLHRHQAFRKGRATGGGEEDIFGAVEKERKDQEKKDEDAAKTAIALERDTMRERLEIFESGQRKKLALIQESAAQQEITEKEAAERQEALEAETLQERNKLLREYIEFLKVAGPEAVNELIKAETRLKVLEDEIEINRVKNFIEQRKRWDEEAKADADKAIRAQEEWEKEQERMEARYPALGLPPELSPDVGEESGISQIGSLLGGLFGGEDQENIELYQGLVEGLEDSFNALANAVGASVRAFVLFGGAGTSFRKFAAELLASIAQMAAIQAVWNLAEGFAKLALAYFGHPTAGASATQHFIAAAVYGTIAGVAAIAGRAVAGNEFKKQTAAGGAGSAQSSTTRQSSQNRGEGQGQPFSSQEDVVVEQGRNAPLGVIGVKISDDSTWLGKMLRFEIANNSTVRADIRRLAEA